METPKEINISTRIQSIGLNSFVVASLEKEQKKLLAPDKFSFEFNVNIKTNEAKKEITIFSHTRIFSDETKTLHLADIDTTGIFELHNFEDVKQFYKGNTPVPVIATFVGVLLATTRGMLLLKSQNTIIDGAMLPIINPMSFFPQPHSAAKK